MSNSADASGEGGVVGSRDRFEVLEAGAERFRLVGELDAVAVGAVQGHVGRLGGDVEFECSNVTFIDSSGLHLLIAVRDTCAAGGGSLVLVNPSQCLIRLLALTGLDAALATRVDGSWQ